MSDFDFPPVKQEAPEPAQPEPRVIVAIVTEQGVFMGDHGQDVTRAVVIDPDETVGALAERVLTKSEHGYPPRQVPAGDRYLTLRLAVTS